MLPSRWYRGWPASGSVVGQGVGPCGMARPCSSAHAPPLPAVCLPYRIPSQLMPGPASAAYESTKPAILVHTSATAAQAETGRCRLRSVRRWMVKES